MVGIEQRNSFTPGEHQPPTFKNFPRVEINKPTDGVLLLDIPGDGDVYAALTVHYNGGISLQITNENQILPVPGILFKSEEDGGKFPQIERFLRVLVPAFKDEQPQTSQRIRSKISESNKIDSDSLSQVQVEEDQLTGYLCVSNIMCDPEGKREHLDDNKMQIEILPDGNVILTISETKPHYDKEMMQILYETRESSIHFKTKENGGKYPIMNEVFSRIAKSLSYAKKRVNK